MGKSGVCELLVLPLLPGTIKGGHSGHFGSLEGSLTCSLITWVILILAVAHMGASQVSFPGGSLNTQVPLALTEVLPPKA